MKDKSASRFIRTFQRREKKNEELEEDLEVVQN